MEGIEEWISILIERGFTKENPPNHRYNHWKERRIYRVHGTGDSILDATYDDRYLRVQDDGAGTFLVRKYRSEGYPWHPKTSFFLGETHTRAELTKHEVSNLLRTIPLIET